MAAAARVWFRWLLVGAGLWFGLRLILLPARRAQIEQARNQAADLAGRLDRLVRGNAAPGPSGEAVAGELARSREQLELLRGLLPLDHEAEALLHSVPEMAAGAGLTIRRFAPEPAHRLDDTIARTAAVDALGGYFEFLGLLDRIAALPRLVLISGLELLGPPDPEGALAGRFSVVVFSLPAPSEESGAAPATAAAAATGSPDS